MKAKKFIILLLLFYFVIAGISNLLQAQDISKYQALFMSKFIDYVQWPDGKENLVVGIVGNSRVLIELQKTVGQKNKATVKKISSAADAATCDMIFLPTDQNKLFSTILSGTEGKSVLIITEGEELAKKGSVISFYVDQGKLKFYINKSAASSRGLQISRSLMSLAKII